MRGRGKSHILRELFLVDPQNAQEEPVLPLDAPVITLFIDEMSKGLPACSDAVTDVQLRTQVREILDRGRKILGPDVQVFLLDGKGSALSAQPATASPAPLPHRSPEPLSAEDPQVLETRGPSDTEKTTAGEERWEVVVDGLSTTLRSKTIYRGELSMAWDIFRGCACFTSCDICFPDGICLHDCLCGRSHLILCQPKEQSSPAGGES